METLLEEMGAENRKPEDQAGLKILDSQLDKEN